MRMLNLYGQASGTTKCLQKLAEQGAAIPQATVDLFAAQEKKFEREVAVLKVGEIPDDDHSLSLLILPSRFLNERTLARYDPHRSNIDLVD